MTRLIWKFLNAPLLILVILFAVSIQTTIFFPPYLIYLKPDVILIAVVWFALKREFLEGGVLTLICAEIAEIHSSGIQGVFFATYMAVFLTVKGFSNYFVFPKLKNAVVMVLFISVFWKALALAFTSSFVDFYRQWRQTLEFLLPGAIVEGALAYWGFQFMEKFDWKTYKNPQALRALEDELHLEEEGF